MSNTEIIKFRYIQAPCCKTQLCWVNPRLPNYCPECGTCIASTVKEAVIYTDDTAQIKYTFPFHMPEGLRS